MDNFPHIKPCPFGCVGDETPSLIEHHVRYPSDGVHPGGSYVCDHSIFCSECGIEMRDESEEALLARWNHRIGDPVPSEEEDE